jgi:hypothetical protein
LTKNAAHIKRFIKSNLVVVVNSVISSSRWEPADDDFIGTGLQFVNEIKGGNIPKEFIPSVEKGFS